VCPFVILVLLDIHNFFGVHLKESVHRTVCISSVCLCSLRENIEKETKWRERFFALPSLTILITQLSWALTVSFMYVMSVLWYLFALLLITLYSLVKKNASEKENYKHREKVWGRAQWKRNNRRRLQNGETENCDSGPDTFICAFLSFDQS
jgi:Ca2+/Na+ antiporter